MKMANKPAQPRILIVDDVPDNIHILMNVLKNDYSIVVATSGEKAIKIAGTAPYPDLILLDIMMPEISGYDVLNILKKNKLTAAIPIIFVTAMGGTNDEAKGLALGAVDYISKPVVPELVKSRVKTHLLLKQHNDDLEARIAQRTEQLQKTKDAILVVMGIVAEHRDPETGEHIQRTKEYVRAMARAMSEDSLFKNELRPELVEIYANAAPLHDIGKVAISDNILLKPGKLSEEEFSEMKRHAIAGEQTIAQAQRFLDEPKFLETAKDIAGGHHEKWDGSGYPRGLKGKDIPLSARIMAYADVYDALISKRPYKPPFSHEKACEIIKEGIGSHFDPDIYRIFTQLDDEFRAIPQRFKSANGEIE